MSAAQNGTAMGLYIAGVLVLKGTSHDFQFSHKLRDTTTKDSSGWEESGEGLRGFSGTMKGYYAVGDGACSAMDILEAYIITRASVTGVFGTSASATESVSATLWVESVDFSAGLEKTTEFSIKLKATGAPTIHA